MVEVFVCSPDRRKTDAQLWLMSEEKQDIAWRIRDIRDRHCFMAADLLIRYIIMKRFGISAREIHFKKNQWGKPFLEGKDKFHFSLSHSGQWAVCAVDSYPVGVDVEEISPIDYPGIAGRNFSPREYKDLMEKDQDLRLEYFYDLWTAKESYVKALGTGLNTPLWTFTVKKADGNTSMIEGPHTGEVLFRQYGLDAGSRLTACTFGHSFSERVSLVGLEEMVRNLSEIK
ncbi:MAG: 4'-phosphopantetheinyl transferase family protein [Bacillota bacterium]